MNKFVVIMLILLVLIFAVTGCMRPPQVCNYDGICTEDETDDCVDCKNTLGRDIPLPTDSTDSGNQADSP